MRKYLLRDVKRKSNPQVGISNENLASSAKHMFSDELVNP